MLGEDESARARAFNQFTPTVSTHTASRELERLTYQLFQYKLVFARILLYYIRLIIISIPMFNLVYSRIAIEIIRFKNSRHAFQLAIIMLLQLRSMCAPIYFNAYIKYITSLFNVKCMHAEPVQCAHAITWCRPFRSST